MAHIMIIMSIGYPMTFFVSFIMIPIMAVLVVVVVILLANLDNSLVNPDAITHLFGIVFRRP